MIKNKPLEFYSFNDQYFMSLIHNLFQEGFFDSNPRMKDIAYSLLFAKSPKVIRSKEFRQQLLDQDDYQTQEKVIRKAKEKSKQIKDFLKKNGDETDWVLEDIPQKSIIFVRSKKMIIKKLEGDNYLLDRDPVKILMDSGDIKLLVDVEESIISKLQNTINFIPNLYCSQSAYEKLLAGGVISDH
jgi:hypothetical protein